MKNARQIAYDKARGNLTINNVMPTKNFKVISKIIPGHINTMDENEKIIHSDINTWNYESEYSKHIYCATEMFDLIHGLSNVAYDIFKIVYNKLQFNFNWVELNTKELLESTSAKYAPQIYKAIKELIDKQIIEKGQIKDMYIINHNLFVYGSYNNVVNKLKGHCVFSDNPNGICEDPLIILR